ncbi:Putative sucrose phosphorylase (EC 2.4.1.7) [Candidatus Synechococcus spongiarum]|uniref:Putative sucrose phosphorylase n=1 Tax=Candidatus Synechococcus spongiarum TaxID=431041 RepID=A0A170T543_9SYNE|nr:Putative sucrose phosphorylase (EC 2.4.1.7) [Candidatus Synechococcus spongiarum]
MPEIKAAGKQDAAAASHKLSRLLQHVYAQPDLHDRLSKLLSRALPPGRSTICQRWDQATAILITYADTVTAPDEPTLAVLNRFLSQDYGAVGLPVLHVLPFLRSSSDRGFAVCDHTELEPHFGDWRHLQALAHGRQLMADLVVNHVSASHPWVQQFRHGQAPGSFMVMAPRDLQGWDHVVRPRSSVLFTLMDTHQGLRPVWTTFGPDQVDLDWRRLEVLEAFARLMHTYVDHGVTWVRLDAIGFLWKDPYTTCLHRPKTRILVQALRLLLEHYTCNGVLLTETNVPEKENLSYLRSGDQAHVAYNFPLPPLLLEALLSNNCDLINRWLAGWPQLPHGSTMLNFTASHDGVGLRPAEGLISPERLHNLLMRCEERGGLVSHRTEADGSLSPYELNIAWWSAMAGPATTPGRLQLERFLASQLLVMSLPGVPAFYLPTLLAAGNDHPTYRKTGCRRDLNRPQIDLQALRQHLENSDSPAAIIRVLMAHALGIRAQVPGFHPEAPMTLLSPERNDMVVLQRGHRDDPGAVWVVQSFREEAVELQVSLLSAQHDRGWRDRLSQRTLAGSRLVLSPYEVLWLQPA